MTEIIPPQIHARIETRLDEIEREEHVRILYACESGSRAWGFASPDSDYDVRFFYLHAPEWYISIDDKRDVIERPIDADLIGLGGWDIRKALRLFRKSDPPLVEWLDSPVVYREALSNGVNLATELREMLPQYFSPRAAFHHYFSLARNTVESELSGDTVKVKKYFYALRPLLACLWIEQGFGVPPMTFERLIARTALPDAVSQAIADLLERKRRVSELGVEPKNLTLAEFIETELLRLSTSAFARKQSSLQPVAAETRLPEMQGLDDLYRRALNLTV